MNQPTLQAIIDGIVERLGCPVASPGGGGSCSGDPAAGSRSETSEQAATVADK